MVDAFEPRSFSKIKIMNTKFEDPGGPLPPGLTKQRKPVPTPDEQKKKTYQKQEASRQMQLERRHKNEVVVKAFLGSPIKEPYERKLRESIRKPVESYSSSILNASLGLTKFVNDLFSDVTDIKTVEVPKEFFHVSFIRQLMVGAGEMSTSNERVRTFHENHPEYRFSGARYRGHREIDTYGAMKYVTNLKNHMIMNLKRFMKRSVFALYPGLSRTGIWAIIDGITNDPRDDQEIEFVDEKTSRTSTNVDSVIRATIQEHRAVLGLVNPTEKVSEMKKDEERCCAFILRSFVFLNRELERMADMELDVEENEDSVERRASLLEQRFNVVPICEDKSHFITIDSGVLFGIMKEICPEFDVSREEFTGEDRDTYWRDIFDFKRRKTSKKKVFTGKIESDGVSIGVHYRRSKVDRPVRSSLSPSAKHEDEKEAGPAAHNVHGNDFVIGTERPGNTDTMIVAVPKRGQDGNDGNLHQSDMRLRKSSNARYYRGSERMNARKKCEMRNTGGKNHLEAMSGATNLGADLKAFQEFVEVQVAQWEAFWQENNRFR